MQSFIVVKSKVYCSKHDVSGLFMVIIDNAICKIVSLDSVFIKSDSLAKTQLNLKASEFLEAIHVAKEQYTVQREYTEMLHKYFINRVDQKELDELMKNIEQDRVAAVNQIQRIVKTSLHIDAVDVHSEFDSISQSQYNEIVISKKINTLTLSQQVGKVLRYFDNNRALTEDSIKKNKNDIGIITIFITGEEFSGICFYIVNCSTKKVLYVFCWIDEQDEIQNAIKEHDAVYDLFQIVARKSEKENAFAPIRKKVLEILWNVNVDRMIVAVERGASGLISQQIETSLKNIGNCSIRAEVHAINALHFDLLYNPSQFDKQTNKEDHDVTLDKNLVAVDLVLSPAMGKKVSELQKGDVIYVFIDTSTPFGYECAKKMNLIADGKNTPIDVEVYSVHYSKTKGYTIFVKITETLYGKAIEEQDVKVKCRMQYQDKKRPSSASFIVGIIAGCVVILAVILILFLILK